MEKITKFYTNTPDLQFQGLVCPLGRFKGFYPLNILAIVANVKFALDCLLMCKKWKNKCTSYNFVHKDDTTKDRVGFCVLHSTGDQYGKFVIEQQRSLLHSEHIFLRCVHSKFGKIGKQLFYIVSQVHNCCFSEIISILPVFMDLSKKLTFSGKNLSYFIRLQDKNVYRK